MTFCLKVFLYISHARACSCLKLLRIEDCEVLRLSVPKYMIHDAVRTNKERTNVVLHSNSECLYYKNSMYS